MITESGLKEKIIKSAAESKDAMLQPARVADIYGQGVGVKTALSHLKAEDMLSHLRMTLYRNEDARHLEDSYKVKDIEDIRKAMSKNPDAVTNFILAIKNRTVLYAYSVRKIPKKNSNAYMTVASMLKPGKVPMLEFGNSIVTYDGYAPENTKEFVDTIEQEFDTAQIYRLRKVRTKEQAEKNLGNTIEDFCKEFRKELDALERAIGKKNRGVLIGNTAAQRESSLTDLDLAVIDIVAQLLAPRYDAWQEKAEKRRPGRANLNRTSSEASQIAPWKLVDSLTKTSEVYSSGGAIELLGRADANSRPTKYMRFNQTILEQLKENSVQENDELTAKAIDTLPALLSYYENDLGRKLPPNKKVEIPISEMEKYIPAIADRQKRVSKGAYVYEGLRLWTGATIDLQIPKNGSVKLSSGSLISNVSTNVPIDSRQISSITVTFTDMVKDTLETTKELWAIMSGTLQIQDVRFKKIAMDIECWQGQQTESTSEGRPRTYTVQRLIELGNIAYNKNQLSRAKAVIDTMLKEFCETGVIGRYTVNGDSKKTIFDVGPGEKNFLNATIEMFPTKEKMLAYRTDAQRKREVKRIEAAQEQFSDALKYLLKLKDGRVKRYGDYKSLARDIADTAPEYGYEVEVSEEQIYSFLEGGMPTEEVRKTVLAMYKEESEARSK